MTIFKESELDFIKNITIEDTSKWLESFSLNNIKTLSTCDFNYKTYSAFFELPETIDSKDMAERIDSVLFDLNNNIFEEFHNIIRNFYRVFMGNLSIAAVIIDKGNMIVKTSEQIDEFEVIIKKFQSFDNYLLKLVSLTEYIDSGYKENFDGMEEDAFPIFILNVLFKHTSNFIEMYKTFVQSLPSWWQFKGINISSESYVEIYQLIAACYVVTCTFGIKGTFHKLKIAPK